MRAKPYAPRGHAKRVSTSVRCVKKFLSPTLFLLFLTSSFTLLSTSRSFDGFYSLYFFLCIFISCMLNYLCRSFPYECLPVSFFVQLPDRMLILTGILPHRHRLFCTTCLTSGFLVTRNAPSRMLARGPLQAADL